MTLAALKADATFAELAERFDVHPNHITQWKSRLFSGAADVYSSVSCPKQEGANVKELHPKIGQQALEIDLLVRARQSGRAERKAPMDRTP